ncbi:MAG: Methylthioribulose-1-phosphate dehydratase [Trizodia sp. TS-e1964]|nr:MAG: Methylthioribulose-1-phosphate dehydratase [Trizodia sp. TS-e1964]
MAPKAPIDPSDTDSDVLITSPDASHPANLICNLCRHFYTLGWVTGTGGGTSIRKDDKIYIAPSGVQKELLQPTDIFVASYPSPPPTYDSLTYLRRPKNLKPSACTPLFLAAFTRRNAGACIHTHSQWAVLVTLLLSPSECFEISCIEQIKGLPARAGEGNLGYFDTLRVPMIENTAHEEDLAGAMEEAMDKYPDTCAILVRRHGIYVWGEDVHKAKTRCESLDYLFQLAIEMRKLQIPWVG